MEEQESMEDNGFLVNAKNKRHKPMSKDINSETFWSQLSDIKRVTALKEENPKWGPRKIAENVTAVSERMIKKYLQLYFFDSDSGLVYRKSTELSVGHRRCVTKYELIEMIRQNHMRDHRKCDTIYESIRHAVFPVGRENVRILFKNELNCESCNASVELPKTTRIRRPIPATYPNSRWQIDLKKMPMHKGYNYVCNIIDCNSRLAFGSATKGKTAKEIADIVIKYIYLYGAPRILQSDNGREFSNTDLAQVVAEFKTRQLHGRPYHPQSQGRVERFNRTMTSYFRVKMSQTKDWVDELPNFYYTYNNRVNTVTKPYTPYQMYFKRPNFAAPVEEQIPYQNLTEEERLFLSSAHLDVEDNETTANLNTVGDEAVDENHTNANIESSQQNNQSEEQQDDNDDNMTLEETLQMLEEISSPVLADKDDGNNVDMNVLYNTNDEIIHTSTRVWESNCHETEEMLVDQQENEPPTDPEPVSSYYNEMYRERFGQYPTPNAKDRVPLQELQSTPTLNVGLREYFHSESLYPVELFGPNMDLDNEFYPAEGDLVDYRTNPAMNKGTAVFCSGYWRKGQCVAAERCENRGTVYVVVDEMTNFSFKLNRNQIRKRVL